ncbi:hypothetical protein [uncultured Ilyobacter sp.]|nr:hypothetical protein [uncultured Ilyobacter sp.]
MKKHYLPNGKIQVTLNIFNKIHTFEALNEQEITAKLIAIENRRAS